MIRAEELTAIGRLVKPHGINGEIAATIDDDIDIDDLRCIVLEIDGIFVPFFIGAWRPRGREAVLVTIDGITDEREAASLCGHDIYALKSDLGTDVDADAPDADGFYMDDLIGFTLYADGDDSPIGTIDDYDDSTANLLLIVTPAAGGNPLYIPLADDLITNLDNINHSITLIMPEGLLSL